MSLLPTRQNRTQYEQFQNVLEQRAHNVTAATLSSGFTSAQLDRHSEVIWWWENSAGILEILMKEANYDIERQCHVLDFHRRYVVPRLGPVPSSTAALKWRSLMTDDYGPMEFSWDWPTAQGNPKVRYSMEAIGRFAGSAIDPVNQTSTVELRHELANYDPRTDWTLFDTLQDSFYDKRRGFQSKNESDKASSPTSVMMAFELGPEIANKAYFFPLNAEQRGITRLEFLKETMAQLRTDEILLSGFDRLLDFLRTPQGLICDIICLAIDCVRPEKSRYKIYVRSSETSFERVWDMMTMGGRLEGLKSTARANLKDLWRLTLGLDEHFDENAALPSKTHDTAGVLYYYDIKAGHEAPRPKVYVPVRHYAASDQNIVNGLGKYLGSRGVDGHFANFTRALKATCSHRRLDEGAGFQTYVGCGIERDGSLKLCSYMNPEIYHPNRWV
ncbi:aromatic prenyltransferase [Ophiobolus disseminans]|uniref:Aromatic prenyltransferase n=1 Tax=Ophiobolus disseminans TaxID=1469910 RepID=A0A6A7ACZ5_9PLEO|nr:aromatic prenyltransferase [Ophiobolus disseminans]